MHKPEIELAIRGKRERSEWGKERVVVTLDRHRHVDVRDLVAGMENEFIGERNHARAVLGLDEMLGFEVAVAKMEAELDARRQIAAEPVGTLDDAGLVDDVCVEGRPSVPQDHFDAKIPLQTELIVRDFGTDLRDLPTHGGLVSGLDLEHGILRAERVDDGERCWQADLETRAPPDLSRVSRANEVLIGRARLAGVPEFAKTELVGRYAAREMQLWQAGRSLLQIGGVDLQERVSAEHRILPADPKPPSARLSVRNSRQKAVKR